MIDLMFWFGFLWYIGCSVNIGQIFVGDEDLCYWKEIGATSFYVELKTLNFEAMTPWRRFLEIEKLRIRKRLGK